MQQLNKLPKQDLLLSAPLDDLVVGAVVDSLEVYELEYALNIKLSTLEKLLLELDVPCGWYVSPLIEGPLLSSSRLAKTLEFLSFADVVVPVVFGLPALLEGIAYNLSIGASSSAVSMISALNH